MLNRVAIIDTGTNSTRLMIAAVEDGRVNELERLTAITRLGEGVDESGILGKDARGRVSASVAEYARRIETMAVGETMLLATSAVRDAANGFSFIEELAGRYGFQFRILSGAVEADLSFHGAVMGMADRARILFVDIGGGSTEIVLGTPDEVEQAVSMKLGCVRLREQYLASDPVSPGELKRARRYIEDLLREEIVPAVAGRFDKAITVAGTMTALAAIDLGLKSYDRDAVHGHVLSAGRVKGLLEELALMSTSERESLDVLEKGRADVIVAGALIADVMIENSGTEEVVVSENDILDGAALALSLKLL